MTAFQGTIPLFLAVDADHSIAGATLNISLDGGKTFTLPATYVPSPDAAQLAAPPRVKSGYSRYFWSIWAGEGEQLPWFYGPNVVYGQLTDGQAVLPWAWQRYEPYIPI